MNNVQIHPIESLSGASVTAGFLLLACAVLIFCIVKRDWVKKHWKGIILILLFVGGGGGGGYVLINQPDQPTGSSQFEIYPNYDYVVYLSSTEANHYDAVYPLSDNKYVWRDSGAGSQLYDRFYCANRTVDGNITSVVAKIRIITESSSYPGKGQIGLRWGGSTKFSTDWSAIREWVTHSWTMTVNPWDDQPWNWTMLDEMEIQARLRGGYNPSPPTNYWTRASYLMLLVVYDTPTLNEVDYKCFDNNSANDAIVKTQWTTNTGLGYYWVEHNMTVTGDLTNTTATAFSGEEQTQWGNTTILSGFDRSTYGGSWVKFRGCANTTDEFNPLTNITDWHYLWIWEQIPVKNERLFGQTNCFARSSFYYNGTATGGKSAIYVAYLNSTDTTYRVTAFDTNTQIWTDSYVHPEAPPSADNHWNPAITKTPSGQIMLIYGYADENPLNYTKSTYSVKTESNLTKLITNWEAEETIPKNTFYGYSYPTPVEWDNTLGLITRDGTVGGADWHYMKYIENETETIWCYLLGPGGTKEWTQVGSTPYLDEGSGSYIHTNNDWQTHEVFRIERLGNLEHVNSAYLNLSISGKFSDVKIYFKAAGGDWEDGGTNDVATGYWTIDITSWVGTNDTRVNDLYFKLESQSVVSTIYVYSASLWINYTGWRDMAWLKSPDAEITTYNCIQQQTWNNTNYGLSAFYINNNTDSTHQGAFLLYTTDEGTTWKNASGTVQPWETPEDHININMAQCGTLTDSFSHVISACLDEFGRIYMTGRKYDLAAEMRKDSHAILWTYDAPIGQAGTWTASNITYEVNDNGDITQVWGEPYIFYDQFYDKPAIWALDINKQVSKFVLYPNQTIWRKVYSDSDFLDVEMKTLGVNNWLESFECLTSEKWYTVGNQTYASTITAMEDDMLYANNFTASRTGLLTEIRIYANLTSVIPKPFSQFAIYNSTWNKLGQTNYVQIGASSLGLTLAGNLAFTTEIAMSVDQEYWLVWRAPNSTDTWQYVKDSSDITLVNRMFNSSLNWESALPASLAAAGKSYLNQSATISAYEVNILIRGLGKYYPTTLTTGWNEFKPLEVDVDKTLLQLNASLWIDVEAYSIVYINATGYYPFFHEFLFNGDIIVASVDDTLRVWCNTSGSWEHNYS